MMSAMVMFRSAFIKVSNASHHRLFSSERPHLLKFIDRVEQRLNRKVNPSFFTRLAQQAENSQEIRILMQEAEKRWGQLDYYLLGAAAHRATQLNDKELALALLKRVPKVDILKVFHILRRVLSQTDSKNLIKEVIAGPVPDSMTMLDFSSILKFCDQCGDVELAERVLSWGKVFRNSERKSDSNHVLGIRLRVLSITDGKKLIEEIIARPAPGSANMLDLGSLLKFCERCDDVELAKRVWSWGQGIKDSDRKLDPMYALGIRLRALEVADSKKLIEEIIATPVPKSMNILHLGSLLKFCDRCVDVELAKRVWTWGKVVRDSNRKEIRPTITYLILCGKTGDMEIIMQVWDEIVVAGLSSRPELIGAMLYVLAAYGDVNQVDRLLATVPLDQIDDYMLASALTAHAPNGLAKEAWNLLKKVESVSGRAVVGITAYNAVVDAFARKGDFQSALDTIRKMTEKGIVPDSVTWTAVLSPCRHYKELPTALQAFEEIKKLDPTDPSAYVLMADVYRACGDFVAADALHEERLSRGLFKETGAVTTTVHGKTYTFHVDEIPPELSEAASSIQAKLNQWSAWLLKQGVSTESIESRHSEQLALAYAVCQKEKTVILRKNLRVCSACHEASVHITKLEGITIHHWDRSRLHIMKDGKCSCGDYY